MRSYEDLMIAAVLPKRLPDGTLGSALDYVLSKQVDGSYFTGPHQWLWKIAVDAALFQTPLDEEMAHSLLDQYGVKGDDKQKAMILFIDLASETIPLDKVKVILPSFVEEVHAERLARVLEDSARILTDGLTVDKETMEGYRDTRRFLVKSLGELDIPGQGSLPGPGDPRGSGRIPGGV
jgi:hypothetical protein